MHPDLVWIADAVTIHGTESLSISGVTYATRSSSGGSYPSVVAEFLYRHCYVRPSPVLGRTDAFAERQFQTDLCASIPADSTWEGGWKLGSPVEEKGAAVRRHGVDFFAPWAQIQGYRRMARPMAGEPCRVRVPAAWQNLSPGYVLATRDSEHECETDEEGVRVRVYWHLTPQAAPGFLGSCFRFLGAEDVSFQVKVLSSRRSYGRADAGVLYMDKSAFHRARHAVRRVYEEVSPGLRDSVPMFTKQLLPGLSVAEDPATGLSFGQDRCLTVAEALCHSYLTDSETRTNSRQSAIVSAFRRRGIDPCKPYLSGSVPESYSLPRAEGNARQGSCCDDRDDHGSMRGLPRPCSHEDTESLLLSAALRIGQDVQDRAYWDAPGTACNWLGRATFARPGQSQATDPTVEALGPDLYGGASGVAVFLAELSTVTGSRGFGKTALGAVECAVRQTRQRLELDGNWGEGLYSGAAGVLLAAARVARVTGCGVSRNIDRLLPMVYELTEGDPLSDDLMIGRGGTVVGLLHLGELSGRTDITERAVHMGMKLRDRVMDTLARSAGSPTMTGLSHGASGLALALLELHARRGDPESAEVARQLLRSEDVLFDERSRNWPDLRPEISDQEREDPSCMVAWCHGAPGMAMARIQASCLDPDFAQQYRRRVHGALETTRAALRVSLADEKYDVSLCHGLSGLIAALWAGGLTFSTERYKVAALDAACRVAREEDKWQSGITCGGPNPSLMVGTSGLGHTFLRLREPRGTHSSLIVG
ncbi:hypothetical protein GCM10010300_52200 [Streptomyces olivaceoviridis]|uniref:lanthionine synthetase LanC family protein n=1 Tax=Streptomyces olivaceoviridis TaxID=1921 RepID=UPI001676A022|nr:lanthionine synthetase LanC family protein [Streptomyces olivaceoviridis]GGZ01733.1 hypothetical protein GCM10010300_52200 [Streptomyces olivaceoviridis]